MSITHIKGRQIYDSRGKPTVETDVITKAGVFRASIPTGVHNTVKSGEALELRDATSEYKGKGVQRALNSVRLFLGPGLVESGTDVRNQQALDELLITMDGTDDKRKYGVNAIAPISMSICRAGAAEKGIPLYQHISELMGMPDLWLPMPVFNMLSGGIHAGNMLPFGEFSVLPYRCKTYSEAYKMGVEMYQDLRRRVVLEYGMDYSYVLDHGGFGPPISTVEEALNLLVSVIEDCGYTGRVNIALDVAASEFYNDGKYDLDFKDTKSKIKKLVTSKELQEMYTKWMRDYPIGVIEDPFSKDDWAAFTELTARSNGVSILGDDLTVTNEHKIHMATRRNACNGFLIKLNQIGTISEALNACNVAHSNGWSLMVSHRSGDTEDPFIADLAVGVQAVYIKAGAPCRGDRTSKYNQLLRIEEDLDAMAVYAGEQRVNDSDV